MIILYVYVCIIYRDAVESIISFVCCKTLQKHAEQKTSCRFWFDYSDRWLEDVRKEFPSTGSLYTRKAIPKRRVAIIIAQSNKKHLIRIYEENFGSF